MVEIMDEVKYTLEQAVKHGLEVEVMSTALQAVSEGTDIMEALSGALQEWDI